MDRILDIKEPTEQSSLYIVTMQHWRGNTYEAHLTKEGFRVLKLKQDLHFKRKVPDKEIEDLIDAVRKEAERDYWENQDKKD